MGTLGPYIRQAREARGLDLRDAAQQTRISVAYLKAIEDEDFSRLPGAVFVKGFLRNYARFLQLPENEVMTRYAETTAPQPAAAAPKQQRTEQPKAAPAEHRAAGPSEERQDRVGVEPFLWAGAVIIGLAVFIVTAMPQKHKGGGTAPKAVSQGTATASVVTAPAGTIHAEKLYLEIHAIEDVWVLVRTDSSPQKKAVLKKGESVTWSAGERFLLSYASVGAAKLVLNGKELTISGPKGAVMRDLIVTAQGVVLQKVEGDQPKPRKPKPATQPTQTVQITPPAPPAPGPAAMPAPAAAPAAPPAAPHQVAPIFPQPKEQ